MTPLQGLSGLGPSSLPEIPELRTATRALEGVFLAQLFRAMRETVPEDGLLGTPPGGDLFTSMFDEHIADTLAQRTKGGIGDMLYNQLRRRIAEVSLTQSGSTPP
jgi:peptidoglycan hydrolase FlgJ